MAAPLVAYAFSQPHARRTTRDQAGGSPLPAPHGPQDVALLRHVRGAAGSLAAAGQRSGHAAAEDCAPHVAHQHRDESARHAGRPRSSVHRHRASWSKESSRCCPTLERLERFEGHFFNWYDSQSLTPLMPRYVSSVDSGNLAAALLTVAQAAARADGPAAIRVGPLADWRRSSLLLQQALQRGSRADRGHQPSVGSFGTTLRSAARRRCAGRRPAETSNSPRSPTR